MTPDVPSHRTYPINTGVRCFHDCEACVAESVAGRVPPPVERPLSPHEQRVAALEEHLGIKHRMDAADAVIALGGSWSALAREHGRQHDVGWDHVHADMPVIFSYTPKHAVDPESWPVVDDIDRPVDRSEWSVSDYVFRVVCRTVGCGSIFARWSAWPSVCGRFFVWLCRREDRRESRRLDRKPFL